MSQALKALRGKKSSGQHNVGVDLIALALTGKKVDFTKVIKMIDDMVANLKVEQQNDNDKKEYCEMQFDTADDKKKGLERSVSNLEKAIAKEKEVSGLRASIREAPLAPIFMIDNFRPLNSEPISRAERSAEDASIRGFICLSQETRFLST